MMAQSKIITVLGTALFLSLTANLFMGGQMLGQSYHHREGAPKPGDEKSPDARREEWKKRDALLREKLSEADRAVVKEHMEGMHEKFKSLKDAADAAEDKADAAKAAEPFDKAALEAALNEQAQAKAALISTMREGRAGMLEKLSPEGREIMKKNGPRFRGKEGREGGRDGGRDGWRGHDREGGREGDRGGRFFDRRSDGPPGDGPRGDDKDRAGYGESAPPPPSDAPPPPREDAPPPREDAPPPAP